MGVLQQGLTARREGKETGQTQEKDNWAELLWKYLIRYNTHLALLASMPQELLGTYHLL